MSENREELLKRFQANMGSEITDMVQSRLKEKAKKWNCSTELVQYINALEERVAQLENEIEILKKST